MQEDNTKEALDKLYQITTLLYGGYYEPKSERDKELADELFDIFVKHTKGLNEETNQQLLI